jgi:hypothetical protein
VIGNPPLIRGNPAGKEGVDNKELKNVIIIFDVTSFYSGKNKRKQ